MKIQFAFLSLFLATAHAGHEPKGLRGRASDDQDQELLDLGSTVVPNGSSATINCGEGGQCCATGQFYGSINYGYSSIGSGGCAGTTYNNASTGTCTSSSCSISCDGTCNVVVKAGSGGGGGGGGEGGGGGGGWSGNDGGYDWRKWVPSGPYGGQYNPYNGGEESRYGYGNNGGEYGGGGGGGSGRGCPTKNGDLATYCSKLEPSNCGSCSGHSCTTDDGENGEVCVPNRRYSGGENESGYSGSYGGASGNSQGGGGGAACSHLKDFNCGSGSGHSCTWTDSGCVPRAQIVGAIDEFDEPESEDSGDFLEMDMVIEEE